MRAECCEGDGCLDINHAHRADKHGVIPEMFPRENGKEGAAGVLKEWLANKDRDLWAHKHRVRVFNFQ
jgi:hypothetical protein